MDIKRYTNLYQLADRFIKALEEHNRIELVKLNYQQFTLVKEYRERDQDHGTDDQT